MKTACLLLLYLLGGGQQPIKPKEKTSGKPPPRVIHMMRIGSEYCGVYVTSAGVYEVHLKPYSLKDEP